MRERWSAFEDFIAEGLLGLRPHMERFTKWLDRWPILGQILLSVSSLLLAFAIGRVFAGQRLVNGPTQFLLLLPAVAVTTLGGGLIPGFITSMIGAAFTMNLYAPPASDPVAAKINLLALALYIVSCAVLFGLGYVQDRQKAQIQELARTLEQRVEQRTAQLQRAHDEIAEFCYSISHDFRAPMRNIVGSSRIIVEEVGPKLDGEHRERLDGIASSATRLSELVDDLLNYARIGHRELAMEWVDLTSLADEACEASRAPGGRWSSAICRVQPNLVAPGDPTLLQIAMTNLVENAFKYAKPNEPLYLEVGEQNVQGRPCYFVRDNGIGFDQQYVHKIFQPFQRLHRDVEYPGTGIGLANVQRIVQRHGGEVWAEGELGAGATFFFTLREKPAELAPRSGV